MAWFGSISNGLSSNHTGISSHLVTVQTRTNSRYGLILFNLESPPGSSKSSNSDHFGIGSKLMGFTDSCYMAEFCSISNTTMWYKLEMVLNQTKKLSLLQFLVELRYTYKEHEPLASAILNPFKSTINFKHLHIPESSPTLKNLNKLITITFSHCTNQL